MTDVSLFVAQCNREGRTIVETIKLVREKFELNLAQAKEVVTAEPCWAQVVAAAAPLHREAIELVENARVRPDNSGRE